MAKIYAKVVGIVVLLVGVVGLFIDDPDGLLGILNVDIVEDIIHLLTGGLLTAVGFAGSDSAAKSVVGGLGVVYILVGIIGFFEPNLFGLLDNDYTIYDNILHLALGALGIGAAAGARAA